MDELEIRRFEQADEVRRFEHGTFALVRLGGMTVGRGSYAPGWKWSTHGGRGPDDRCQVEHVGLVVSGRATASMDDGTEVVMEPGDLFAIPPGHASWVGAGEPYVSLHFLAAEDYAGE